MGSLNADKMLINIVQEDGALVFWYALFGDGVDNISFVCYKQYISYVLYVNRNAKNIDFVVKRYAVRKTKVRPYVVCNLKIKQYAVRTKNVVSPL